MKISEILANRPVTVSVEVFPPHSEAGFQTVLSAVEKISEYKPDFISVTYGAGGGTSKNTFKIASDIQNGPGITALSHLSCVSSTKQEMAQVIEELKQSKLENVLALRGDIPKNSVFPENSHYRYAYELVEEIKAAGDFCVGAACYPEGHCECDNKSLDIKHLKQKVDSGCDFLITQIFFDNNALYSFLYRALDNDINVPVIAGIMPVTNGKQVKRICELSGTSLPTRFKSIVDKFGDNPAAMKQAGIVYATEQIIDLIANGVKGIHIYTMNKPDVAASILSNLSEILRPKIN